MDIVNIEGIRLCPRYKLLRLGKEEYYLIDLETNNLSLILPITQPFLKKKMYRITKSEYQQLRTGNFVENHHKQSLFSILSGGVLSFVIAQMLPGDFGLLKSNLINLLLFWVIITAVFRYRFFFHKKKPKIEPFLQREPTNILLKSKDWEGTKMILFNIISLIFLAVFSFIVFSIQEQNLIYHFFSGLSCLAYFSFGMAYYSKDNYSIQIIN